MADQAVGTRRGAVQVADGVWLNPGNVAAIEVRESWDIWHVYSEPEGCEVVVHVGSRFPIQVWALDRVGTREERKSMAEFEAERIARMLWDD